MDDVKAIYHHKIRDESKFLDKHKYCLKDFCCLYHNNKEKYSEATRLPLVFHEKLKKVFSRTLTMQAWVLHKTRMEVSIMILGVNVPKTQFCGRVRIELAMSSTVSHFNNSAGSRAELFSTIV